jgi:hypothetical protein
VNRSFDAAQAAQNVHSKVQMNASEDVGGSSASQHSQLGLSSSISSPAPRIYLEMTIAASHVSTSCGNRVMGDSVGRSPNARHLRSFEPMLC